MSVDAQRVVLSSAPPTRRERVIAIAVIAISFATLAVVTPFARVHMSRLDAFIPTYQTALMINDLITAVLLFGQFARLRSYALLVIACGYLFDALIIIPHTLSFPGLFGPDGIIGGGAQTTAWLFVFWHGGFALFVIAYALLAGRKGGGAPVRGGAAKAILGSIVLVTALVGAIVVFVTEGHDLLPVVIQNGDYSMLVTKGVSPAIWALSLIALAALWRRRKESVLDLWLVVVVCVWLCDVALSAVVGSARFDLGFYLGRTYGLLAASFLLCMLLFELNRLYSDLGDALAIAEERNTQLIASREQLARVQRYEGMAQLTGGVAHDFNNLLTVLTGSLDLIRRAPDNPVKIERLARAGLDAAKRGERLTQQLLTFARRQVTRPETVNPNRLLADFEGLLNQATGDGFKITMSLNPMLDPARIDPAQFESAILNLIVNARDAMKSGGQILIETSNIELDDQTAATLDCRAGSYVVIAVSDKGSGMSREVAAKAFDPFFTTKDVGHGSGMGLSQVYGFARNAEGQAKIYSEPGIGTTVKVYLPKSSGQPRPTHSDLGGFPVRPARGGEVVLVVEDDEAVLDLAVESLADLGYGIVTAVNARAALDVLRTSQRIDVLFSDVVMPGGMNGAQLAIEARRLRPGLRVLLTSGYTAAALSTQHGLPDNLELLGKPYRREDLADKLRLVMGA